MGEWEGKVRDNEALPKNFKTSEFYESMFLLTANSTMLSPSFLPCREDRNLPEDSHHSGLSCMYYTTYISNPFDSRGSIWQSTRFL